MSEQTTNTLLLNILEQLGDLRQEVGGIKAQLAAGAKTHARLEGTIEQIGLRTNEIESEVSAIGKTLVPDDGSKPLTTRVKDVETYIGRQGIIVGISGSIVVGVLSLFVWAFSAFKDDVLRWLRH